MTTSLILLTYLYNINHQGSLHLTHIHVHVPIHGRGFHWSVHFITVWEFGLIMLFNTTCNNIQLYHDGQFCGGGNWSTRRKPTFKMFGSHNIPVAVKLAYFYLKLCEKKSQRIKLKLFKKWFPWINSRINHILIKNTEIYIHVQNVYNLHVYYILQQIYYLEL